MSNRDYSQGHPLCTSCGSFEHHAHDCSVETKKRRETVEVVSDFSRKCSKCKKVAWGKAKSFHYSELTKNFEVSEVEMPKGWATVYHAVYYNAKQETPTMWAIPICTDCIPSVMEFIGWAPEKKCSSCCFAGAAGTKQCHCMCHKGA